MQFDIGYIALVLLFTHVRYVYRWSKSDICK